MPVCFFDKKHNTSYKCEYEIRKECIEVTVDYDIDDERENNNGIISIPSDIEFKERDIFIVDYDNKKNYLLKKAYYCGYSSTWGTPDGGAKTKFKSQIYFSHGDRSKLCDLPPNPKVKKIKVFSKAINDLIGCPSLDLKKDEDNLIISLSKKDHSKVVLINEHNIKSISISDDWKSVNSIKNHNINIDFNGFIELELTKRVNYDDVFDFVYELIIFMQLYRPDKFVINRIHVMVEDVYYELALHPIEIETRDKRVDVSVEDNLLDFLKRCYTVIPYRKSKSEIRNIPYIVLKTSRGLEDNFLMFYRFIECYYKKQPISGIRKSFVSYSIKEYNLKNGELSDEEIEKYSQEIISLRNRYVHSGYYIKNSSLRVSFEKVGNRKNPKDYTVNNVDSKWIYDRAIMLYKIVIDIIFKKMLGYEEYDFKRHF